MTNELCTQCTGSYTGEFSPKWRGPWAAYFDASGNFLEAGGHQNADSQTLLKARTDRLAELRAQNRVHLGFVYSRGY